MADLNGAKQAAQADVAGDMLTKLAERLGGAATASAVFAAPVEREGMTVVPVAKVRWGFGGGFGPNKEGAEGSGGGGGVMARPMGFIEIREGQAQYRPLRDPLRLAATALVLPVSAAAAVGVMFLGGWMMSRSIRRSLRLRRPHMSLPRPHVADLPRPHIADHLPRPHISEVWPLKR